MKRVAIIFGVVAALLLADGLYMVLANYHPGDANTFFGNQTWNLSDGEVTLISAGFLILAALIMWVIAVRRDARSRARRPAEDQSTGEQPDQPDSRTASRA
jgi:membrane protein implicated in regulation of membrane protease activity